MTAPVKQRVDKDAIIADLQAKLRSAEEKIADLKANQRSLSDQLDKNYENGLAWKKAAEESKREVSGIRDRIALVDSEAMKAQGALRFAEGFISASGGWVQYQAAAYPKTAEATEAWS